MKKPKSPTANSRTGIASGANVFSGRPKPPNSNQKQVLQTPSDPGATPKKILICTMGDTPQIITETLWALLNLDRPWQPDQVDIVTTYFVRPRDKSVNVQRLCDQVLSADGAFSTLPWIHKIPEIRIVIPIKGDNTSQLVLSPSANMLGDIDKSTLLSDVNDESDAMHMGEAIFSLLSQAKQNQQEIHLSLAGGRKTMAAHALTALTLMGDTKDRASHVLIPSDFENHSDFWHPDHRPNEVLKLPQEGRTFMPSDLKARIALFDVPVFPVATMLKGKYAALLKSQTLKAFMQEIEWAKTFDSNPCIHFCDPTENPEIILGEKSISVTYKIYAALWLMAKARKEIWQEDVVEGMAGKQSLIRHGFATAERVQQFLAVTENLGIRSSGQSDVKDLNVRLVSLHLRLQKSEREKKLDTSALNDASIEFRRVLSEGKDEFDKLFGSFISDRLVRTPGSGKPWYFLLNCPPENITFSNFS
jgi:CRISPR-associated protein (TIGR02584 family)